MARTSRSQASEERARLRLEAGFGPALEHLDLLGRPGAVAGHGAVAEAVEVESRKGKAVYEGVVKQGDDLIGIEVDANGNVLGRHSEKNEKDEHK